MLDFSITKIMKLTFAYLQFSGIARGGGGRGCAAVVLAPPLFLRTSQKLFVLVQSLKTHLVRCWKQGGHTSRSGSMKHGWFCNLHATRGHTSITGHEPWANNA